MGWPPGQAKAFSLDLCSVLQTQETAANLEAKRLPPTWRSGRLLTPFATKYESHRFRSLTVKFCAWKERRGQHFTDFLSEGQVGSCPHVSLYSGLVCRDSCFTHCQGMSNFSLAPIYCHCRVPKLQNFVFKFNSCKCENSWALDSALPLV